MTGRLRWPTLSVGRAGTGGLAPATGHQAGGVTVTCSPAGFLRRAATSPAHRVARAGTVSAGRPYAGDLETGDAPRHGIGSAGSEDGETAYLPGPVSDALAAVVRLLFLPTWLAGSVALLVWLSQVGAVGGPHQQPFLVVAVEICFAPPVALVGLGLLARQLAHLLRQAAWAGLVAAMTALDHALHRHEQPQPHSSRAAANAAEVTVVVTDLPQRSASEPGGGGEERALTGGRPALPSSRPALPPVLELAARELPPAAEGAA